MSSTMSFNTIGFLDCQLHETSQTCISESLHTFSVGCFCSAPSPYLFLPQDDDSAWFDWVPGCQVISTPPLLTVLVRVPLAVPCGPGDANVVPPPITHLQRQLGNLLSKENQHIKKKNVLHWGLLRACRACFLKWWLQSKRSAWLNNRADTLWETRNCLPYHWWAARWGYCPIRSAQSH